MNFRLCVQTHVRMCAGWPCMRVHSYAGRVLADDSQTLLEAKIADKSAVHLVVAAAPAPAPQPFPAVTATGGTADSGTLGLLASSGAALLRKDGSRVSVDALRGKVVALYFSAHWCPPCRGFTPKLKEFYEQVNAGETGRGRLCSWLLDEFLLLLSESYS